jgi:four helix bundle protein
MARKPYEIKRSIANALDSCMSISRNIAEGYCRRSLKEYLNFLNYSLASCGEFHSCYYCFCKAGYITSEEYNKLDELHYKVENQLINLVGSLQKKQGNNDWNDKFTNP